MKNISLFLLAPGIVTLTACANYEVDSTPLRSSHDILLDIKTVADSIDLTDVEFVGKRLQIDLVKGPETPVYESTDQLILGYGSEVKQRAGAKEYRLEDFRYGIFRPRDRNFERVIISVSMNVTAICISQVDVKDVFHKVDRSVNPHISWTSFSYNSPKVEGIRTYFRFGEDGCLRQFGFFQNSKKE
ncbi:hypothetical protein [Burkholderia stabilis]|uniref:hypothetical protein n=1 Tax=Burkholderia stabilis TaxID=95485 RepID=UPI0011473DDE|nr:hypothetical protein [Burkholderia stabilis]